MQTLRFGPWIAITLVTALSSLSSASSVVEAEYELKMPRVFQQRIIDKLWTSLQREVFSTAVPVPDQSIHAVDTEVLLSGIGLEFQTQLQKPSVPSTGTSVTLESRNVTAHLRVQSVSVDQYILREIGGVVGRFHLQARCENLDLMLKPGQGQFRMNVSPVFSGARVSSKLEDVQVTWSKEAWILNPMNCTGAQGFEELIAEHVLNMTRDSDILTPYKPQLMEYVQKYLDQRSVDISKPRVLTSQRLDIQYSMRIDKLTNNGQNLLASGVLAIQFKNAATAKKVYLPLAQSSWVQAKSSALQLRVPEKILETVVEKAFLPTSWSTQLRSSQVPGFASVQNLSKLVLCFIWPELHDFGRDASFLFQLKTEAPISLTGQQLRYHIESALRVNMLAPVNVDSQTKFVPFMDFRIPLRSDISLSVAKGQLAAVFTNVDFGLEAHWNEDYVRNYHPKKYFAAEKIRERVLQEAQGQRLQYTLPRFQIMDSLSLQLQSVSSTSSNDFVFTLN